MAKKRRRKKSSKGKDLAATIIGGIIALPILLPIGILYGLLRALVGLFKLFSGERAREEKLHRSFAEIDQLDGRAFEHFVAGLLRKNGYSNVQVTKPAGTTAWISWQTRMASDGRFSASGTMARWG